MASSNGFNPKSIMMFPEKCLCTAVSFPSLIWNAVHIIESVSISLNLTYTLIIQLLTLVPAIETSSVALNAEPGVINIVLKQSRNVLKLDKIIMQL